MKSLNVAVSQTTSTKVQSWDTSVKVHKKWKVRDDWQQTALCSPPLHACPPLLVPSPLPHSAVVQTLCIGSHFGLSALWLQLEVHLEGIRAESWKEGDTLQWTPRSTRGHTRGGHTAMDSKEGDTLHWTPGSSSSPAMKVHQRTCDDASDADMTLNCFAFNLTISTTRRQDRIKANLCPLFRRQVGKAIEQGSLDAEQVEHKCFYLERKLQVS